MIKMTVRSGLVMLLLATRSLFADFNLQLVGPATYPSPGDKFVVDAEVMGVTDLYAFQFDLSYDPKFLSALSVTEGTLLPGGGPTFFVPGTIDNVDGTVISTADSLIGLGPGVTGDGTLVEFQFEALRAGTSSLSVSNAIFLDSALNDITTSGTFQVGSVSITPEPTSVLLLATELLAFMLLCYQLKRRRKID